MMRPAERHVDVDHSSLVIHTPSAIARRTFLYLLRSGIFVYEPGYRLKRTTFDSFLVLLVRSGSLNLSLPEGEFVTKRGQFMIVDCYEPHQYGTDESTDVLWMHFDGEMARAYYNLIVSKLGNVFVLRNPSYAINRLVQINDMAQSEAGYSEPRMAKTITDVLTEFAAESELGAPARQSQAVEDSIAYISSHLSEPLSVGELAARAYLSEYHFIRVFKRETGLTPYAYILDSRIHAAQYLLVNGTAPLKVICEQCGFSSTFVFCAAFKRKMGISPLSYRVSSEGSGNHPCPHRPAHIVESSRNGNGL